MSNISPDLIQMEMEAVKPDDIDLSLLQKQEDKLIVTFTGLPTFYQSNADNAFVKIIQLFTGADQIQLKFEDTNDSNCTCYCKLNNQS
jgi:hypothetical protein